MANTLKPVDAKGRFWTTVWSQGGGFAILVVVFSIFVLDSNPLIEKGVRYIGRSILVYVGGSIVIFLISFLINWIEREDDYDDLSVDIGILSFIWFDVAVLLFLVCQENGLCRSMLLPVFLLIPIAYLTVENPDKRHRILLLLGIIISGIAITWYLADRSSFSLLSLAPTFIIYAALFAIVLIVENQRLLWQVGGVIVAFLLLSFATVLPYWLRDVDTLRFLHVTTTDFHHDAHNSHDRALFLVSLLSLLIPLLQILVVLYQTRPKRKTVAATDATAKPQVAS
jgi:hypothetical protein